MRRKLVFKCAAALIAVFSVSVSVFNIHENRDAEPLAQLVFENIEALADNEGSNMCFCMGTGDVDCYGYKVYIKVDNLR
jgi:hypothetical protein